MIKHKHIQTKITYFKNKHILQEFIPKTKEIGNEIDNMYKFLNDNNILLGETISPYYNAHDLISDILNEFHSDNPNEQEIRTLYNALIIQEMP